MKKLIKKIIRKLFAKKYYVGENALYGGKVAVKIIGEQKKGLYVTKSLANNKVSTAYGWQLKKIKREKND